MTVQAPGDWNVYTIPDLSVTSGDLLLGFRIDHSATEYPVANDRTLPHRGRSYYSGNGGAFQLIDSFAGYEGNFGIRARVLTGSGLQVTVE